MYIGSSISQSPTIALLAGAAVTKGAGKAVKFDASGDVILCDVAGEAALGVLILQTADAVADGESVTVQISGVGQAVAGGVIAAGDLLTVDVSGQLVKAATGNYVLGQALEAGISGGFIHFQMLKGSQLN